ncbi:hypothetical protein BESB_015980 [Besnoitia besnoiti]|uniref:Dense granule protein GRA11 n=1 Tax=Besnoitia besnoiti TaxID=94643 RepID=A0A2A9MA78_BESBE|nr:hypothetical protein BESB_015980 [Besnoitia besnoiti]PFH32280.1 hypothetical protein BESB_015980 [Besnoitia besnoiti]
MARRTLSALVLAAAAPLLIDSSSQARHSGAVFLLSFAGTVPSVAAADKSRLSAADADDLQLVADEDGGVRLASHTLGTPSRAPRGGVLSRKRLSAAVTALALSAAVGVLVKGLVDRSRAAATPAKSVDQVEPPRPLDEVELPRPLDEVELPRPPDQVKLPRPRDQVEPPRPLDEVEPPRPFDEVELPRPRDQVEPPRPLDEVEPPRPFDEVELPRPLDQLELPRPLDQLELPRRRDQVELPIEAMAAKPVAAKPAALRFGFLEKAKRYLEVFGNDVKDALGTKRSAAAVVIMALVTLALTVAAIYISRANKQHSPEKVVEAFLSAVSP